MSTLVDFLPGLEEPNIIIPEIEIVKPNNLESVKVIPLGKHAFDRLVKQDRYAAERKMWDLRMEEALKTDKSIWKRCSLCGESFPLTDDFWVKNGKLPDGTQRYRPTCGGKRFGQRLGGNGCYTKTHTFSNYSSRDHNERMLTWRGQLSERRAGCINSDINKIQRKKKNGLELTDFEKSLDVTGKEFMRNGLKVQEAHPLTTDFLVEVLKNQKYLCNELGYAFVLEFPNLDNLSIDSLPGCLYHRPEEIQLVVQWFNRAMNSSSREIRDDWIKKHWRG